MGRKESKQTNIYAQRGEDAAKSHNAVSQHFSFQGMLQMFWMMPRFTQAMLARRLLTQKMCG